MKLIKDLGTKNKWGRRRGLYICPDCETENEAIEYKNTWKDEQ